MKADFESYIEGKSFIMKLKGDLIGDESGPKLVGKVSDALNEGITNCIIDLSQVRYISSSGIGVLITILTKMRNAGGEVYLTSPSEHVKKLLIITKLNNIFNVYDSLEEAREKIR
ncbi:STAS domain-containing protein [Negadavirga shengliensis]|uniref:Anti-sigma factor antagonist n=1 Tax=Negadavirga shengliensis TaxID=1389218 RepID=A0ABV9T7V9_9BACT